MGKIHPSDPDWCTQGFWSHLEDFRKNFDLPGSDTNRESWSSGKGHEPCVQLLLLSVIGEEKFWK